MKSHCEKPALSGRKRSHLSYLSREVGTRKRSNKING